MKKLALSLTALMLFFSPAAVDAFHMPGTLYVEGPNERGEGPLPPATGMTEETLGLFFVDIYGENWSDFAGFQTVLDFLDDELVNAAGSTIFVAYHHLPPEEGAPWGDRQITWNQEFLPEIMELASGSTFGLLSMERMWIGPPVNDWRPVDKTITVKTWLMSVGYWYIPGAEGDGTQTYTIDAHNTGTYPDVYGNDIPFTAVTGSVTIGGPVVPTLVVRSDPIPAVSITGDKPGTTDYVATCDEGQVVNLAAPPTATVGPVRYDFARWIVDGADQPAGQTQVQITVDGQTTATAAYAVRTYNLIVGSTPISGLSMGGDKPGTTDYSATCYDQQIVALTAPSAVTIASVHYDFVRWIVDGSDQPVGQTQVEVTMNAGHTATAVYAVWTHTLTVQSMPMNSVAVTGDKPGATPYSATCDDYQLVTITAPETIPAASGGVRRFLYWIVDNEPQSPGEGALQLRMDADHTATAIYDWRLDGDNNADCVVNILDMLHVRQRLNTRCGD